MVLQPHEILALPPWAYAAAVRVEEVTASSEPEATKPEKQQQQQEEEQEEEEAEEEENVVKVRVPPGAQQGQILSIRLPAGWVESGLASDENLDVVSLESPPSSCCLYHSLHRNLCVLSAQAQATIGSGVHCVALCVRAWCAMVRGLGTAVRANWAGAG